MDEAWTWGILFGIASLVSGSMIGVLGVIVPGAAKKGWLWIALSPIPLLIWDLLWVVMANPPDSARRTISIVIGMVTGAVVMFGVTEFLHQHAGAQQPGGSSSISNTPDGSESSTVSLGASGNFNFGQRGGSTTQTYTIQKNN